MKLQPGDHVAQKDLTDEQYHAIAKKFMEAGAKEGEYGNAVERSKHSYFGWSCGGGLYHGDWPFPEAISLNGRLLTPSQILEDDVWFERGELPPVGTKCEHKKHNKEVFIVAHHHFCKDRTIWCDRAESGQLCYGSSYDFRPIKSDRDKAIEAAALAIETTPIAKALWIDSIQIAKALFEAGLLKLPEGDK